METTEKHEEKASEILSRAAKLLNDAPKVYYANFELMKEQDACLLYTSDGELLAEFDVVKCEE